MARSCEMKSWRVAVAPHVGAQTILDRLHLPDLDGLAEQLRSHFLGLLPRRLSHEHEQVVHPQENVDGEVVQQWSVGK